MRTLECLPAPEVLFVFDRVRGDAPKLEGPVARQASIQDWQRAQCGVGAMSD